MTNPINREEDWVEQIARLVDPETWADFDEVCALNLGYPYSGRKRLEVSISKARQIAALSSPLTQGSRAEGWKTIAAHDGTRGEVLLLLSNGIKVVGTRHHPAAISDDWHTVPGAHQVSPTHWMPLPAAPSFPVDGLGEVEKDQEVSRDQSPNASAATPKRAATEQVQP